MNHKTQYRIIGLLLLLSTLGPAVAAAPSAAPPNMPGQPTSLSFFGVNAYLTGYERWSIPNEMETLLPMGTAIGLQWTREEFVWANIEPSQGSFTWWFMDDRLWNVANAGYGVVGMLLTTPTWARKPSCAGSYWCPPQNVNDFANFVGAVVERYDADGYNDSAGSPRVDYWEIWNEPNHAATWPGTPAEYASLLKAGYNAVKAADPTAQVLVGGVYLFDGTQGLDFLNRMLQADPTAWNAFDILSIHPYMPDAAPDQPGLWEPVTMLSRLQRAQDWVVQHGGGKDIWVTEVGWSTCTTCGPDFRKTEDQQANYLLRTHAMALATGMKHLSLFQLEDKFDGGTGEVWGNCAIVRTASAGYTPKKAYYAMAVMTTQLAGVTYFGEGPVHALQWSLEDGRKHLDAPTRFDYRFSTPEGGYVDVIWRADELDESIFFPVEPGQDVTWVSRDGQEVPLTPAGGYVSFGISGWPIYLRQDPPPPPPPTLELSTNEIGFLSEPGIDPPPHPLLVRNSGSGTFSWTLSLESGTTWFSTAPLSGTAPSTVTVWATAPLSGTGLFTGSLTVDAGAAGQEQVILWLRQVDALEKVYLPLIGS